MVLFPLYTSAMPGTQAKRRTRRVVVVDESALAARIGDRLRAARLRRGLSQRQLAGERFTSQYVSSLERGAVKPSMAALNYLAERLEVPIRDLLDPPAEPWHRMYADLTLAAGDFPTAEGLYRDLAETTASGGARAEVLAGLAEALCRMNRGGDAVSPAAEALEFFQAAGRPVDAARAAYWLASAQYQADNPQEARSLLENLLAQVRAGLRVESGFKLRLLTSLGSVSGLIGDHRAALAYLEEGRDLISELDGRARATYFYSLAVSYKQTGDLEAAVRAGMRSLALYEAIDAQREVAALHNHLALTYLRLGNLERAEQLALQAADEAERLSDDRMLSGIVETRAQVALAAGRRADALQLAARAIELGERSASSYAVVGGWLTTGRAHHADGRRSDARAAFDRAAELVEDESSVRRRETLIEVAEFLGAIGEDKRALEMYRRAVH